MSQLEIGERRGPQRVLDRVPPRGGEEPPRQQFLIERVRYQAARIAELEAALRNVIAHTGYLPDAPRELFERLLASCARIARPAQKENPAQNIVPMSNDEAR